MDVDVDINPTTFVHVSTDCGCHDAL